MYGIYLLRRNRGIFGRRPRADQRMAGPVALSLSSKSSFSLTFQVISKAFIALIKSIRMNLKSYFFLR